MKRGPVKYTSREGRVKTTLWLDRRVLEAITAEANDRKVSKQSIIESSLKERYSEVVQLDRDAAIADRLNRLERGQRRIEEQIVISAEAHALFIRMWLASTPEVPSECRDSAIQSARERYERYLQQLTKRLGQEVGASKGEMTEVSLKPEDF